MFDWGSGVCVWSTNAAAKVKFNAYPLLLNKLIIQHDTAWNWDDPGAGLLWNTAQQTAFINETMFAYKQLCAELGPDYNISFFLQVF